MPEKSKQTDVLAAIAGVWNCVSEVKGNPWRLFSIRSTSGWRILQGLIVSWLETEEMGVFMQCFYAQVAHKTKGSEVPQIYNTRS